MLSSQPYLSFHSSVWHPCPSQTTLSLIYHDELDEVLSVEQDLTRDSRLPFESLQTGQYKVNFNLKLTYHQSPSGSHSSTSPYQLPLLGLNADSPILSLSPEELLQHQQPALSHRLPFAVRLISVSGSGYRESVFLPRLSRLLFKSG